MKIILFSTFDAEHKNAKLCKERGLNVTFDASQPNGLLWYTLDTAKSKCNILLSEHHLFEHIQNALKAAQLITLGAHDFIEFNYESDTGKITLRYLSADQLSEFKQKLIAWDSGALLTSQDYDTWLDRQNQKFIHANSIKLSTKSTISERKQAYNDLHFTSPALEKRTFTGTFAISYFQPQAAPAEQTEQMSTDSATSTGTTVPHNTNQQALDDDLMKELDDLLVDHETPDDSSHNTPSSGSPQPSTSSMTLCGSRKQPPKEKQQDGNVLQTTYSNVTNSN